MPQNGIAKEVRQSGAADRGAASRRRKRKLQIRREAERRLAEMSATPTLREIYAPRVIFAAIFILAIIGGFLIGRVGRSVRDDSDRPIPHYTAIKSLDVLATALGRYRMHVGEFPSTEDGLAALNKDLGKAGWDGPYLVQLMEDPWGRLYRYERRDGGLPRLFSCGPDGEPGTHDDLFPGDEFFDPGTDWTNGWKSKEQRLPEIVLEEDM